MVIAEALKCNEALIELNVKYNPCGADGGRHLMNMLMTNDVLERLPMEGCSWLSTEISAPGAKPPDIYILQENKVSNCNLYSGERAFVAI